MYFFVLQFLHVEVINHTINFWNKKWFGKTLKRSKFPFHQILTNGYDKNIMIWSQHDDKRKLNNSLLNWHSKLLDTLICWTNYILHICLVLLFHINMPQKYKCRQILEFGHGPFNQRKLLCMESNVWG